MLTALSDHILPGRCVVCGCTDQVKAGICGSCRSGIRSIPAPVCEVCGTTTGTPGTCIQCLYKKPPFDRMMSAGVFEGVLKDMIHRFKYNRATIFKKPLAGLIYEMLLPTGIRPDMITFVPMHWTRMIGRGYNQSALIARELSGYMGVDVRYDVILKRYRTRSQVGMRRKERMRNLRGAFVSNGVKGKSVMVVDDVITTARTAHEVSGVLKAAGASSVFFVSVGRIIR